MNLEISLAEIAVTMYCRNISKGFELQQIRPHLLLIALRHEYVTARLAGIPVKL